MNEENHIGLSQTALEEDQFLKLPDECFIRIFKFLDFPSSANVALVCSRFYELICDLERDKHPLELCYSQASEILVITHKILSINSFHL